MTILDRDSSDFAAALSTYMSDADARFRRSGFEYGAFDCATFVCDWIEQVTGRDPMAAFRGHYTTKIGALRALKRYGAENAPRENFYYATVELLLGPPIAVHEAKKGDLAWLQSEKILGIVAPTGAHPRAWFLYEDKMRNNTPQLGYCLLRRCDKAFRLNYGQSA